ncbi:hypothetical protein [Azospirillum sp.]|uniref:hypothetical protein n=1 Tax=Azospirillum sp. TaxID=34012 RepID=UPI002D6D2548|nr:hypothetical protein [Azospirillum sp.]HYD68079.1 hypothetical protein [Azospirillum sp.]
MANVQTGLHSPAIPRPSWLRRVMLRRAERRALDTMEPRDRERVLAEVGLCESDLPCVLDRSGHVAELLPEALRLNGVDAVWLDERRRDLLWDLQRVCSACPTVRQCRRLIAAGAPAAEHHAVCPNAGTLTSLGTAA